MNKGEIQYRQRMEDLRVLKLEIRKLQREKVILNKSVSSIEELRREIFHTQVYHLPLFFTKDSEFKNDHSKFMNNYRGS